MGVRVRVGRSMHAVQAASVSKIRLISESCDSTWALILDRVSARLFTMAAGFLPGSLSCTLAAWSQ